MKFLTLCWVDDVSDSSNWHDKSFVRPVKKQRSKNPSDKWWENKSWLGILEEMQKQEKLFEFEFKNDHKTYQKRKERKRENVRRHNKIVSNRLNWLKSKYGLAPQEDDFKDGNDPFGEGGGLSCSLLDDVHAPSHVDMNSLHKLPASPGEALCYLCRRKFPSFEKLELHEMFSKLHQINQVKLSKIR